MARDDCAFCKTGWPVHHDSTGDVHIDVLGNHKEYGNCFPCPTPELPEYLQDEEES